MATVMGSDLVGLKVFSRDGTKIGKVKSVVSDDAETRDYLVIGRSLRRDLVIPIDTLETPGDRIVVPHSGAYCDSAPAVKASGAISAEEGIRLENFYRARSA
ncbi:MAG TPA: PRC-barrel domain-containing protein [Thermoleophilia bacterium]|nr:PRC-barrel domain-containing protein [Thermoleophilia bacterium]